eukprot:jgi/Chrzof1/3225/Cz12g16190.t1
MCVIGFNCLLTTHTPEALMFFGGLLTARMQPVVVAAPKLDLVNSPESGSVATMEACSGNGSNFRAKSAASSSALSVMR